ncbi:SCO family protein [Photobacterium halotolerans]|uniref:SCO family protein n=1 Tax=Photobacterium halotolerans TaxID=265726 RepID=A0A7X5BN24_9GAMM|nr:SCO family protein [Photobacterium halotolerans]NAW66520.1 SCO family protein [Photobacterium halotolerans]NAX47196.1 SCO family protein [Photobacterium halotolerans]
MKFQWIILAVALVAGLATRYLVDSHDASVAEAQQSSGQLESGKESVDLFNTNDNRLRVVYFGFTHCPDVCPTSLAILGAALKAISQDELNKVWPVFITLDPERDTPEKSAQYAQYFHKDITGMTGTMEQTQLLAKKYGVLYMKTKQEDSALEYSVDHSSYFYLLKPDGTLLEKVPHTLNPNILVDAIDRNERLLIEK